ncbi:HEAT repeat domain-containing protein [Rufibacter psychrotolerans]|uniref:HEAT repeat domain-containing protein n=1 Tax=Rufibacter psychrotolerans TaxID=2812556 RepID=UPI0019670AE5|nr:HEAT repeat domain-containing protein [Rufibacter sp. SYSU D00308]
MQFEQIETLLEKYYNGETSLEEETQLQAFFRHTKLLPDSLKPHAVQFQFYAQEQDVQVDKFLSDDWLFEKIENPTLSADRVAEKPKSTSFFQTYSWQIAASISLLIIAFWAGNYFRQSTEIPTGSPEVVALKQDQIPENRPETETAAPAENSASVPLESVAATEPAPSEHRTARFTSSKPRQVKQVLASSASGARASASDRLQLVTQGLQTEGLTEAESKKIIKLLVKTMNQDGNLNVRLAACEALYQFKDHKEVRKAFIHALGTQTDPLMQLTLIEIVVKLKEATAVPKLQQLMHNEDLLPIVKYKAQEGLGTLI